jgi:long-chain acyl-CoA synthetase
MASVLHRLVDWAQTQPDSPAQRFKSNGEWKTLTAKDFCDRVYQLALYLETQGVGPGQIGCVFAYNSAEWTQSDLALMLIGAKSAGIYPNSIQKDVLYILEHTESTVLVVQDREYFERIVGKDGATPLPKAIRLVIVLDGDTSISELAVSFDYALAQGRKLASERRESAQLQKYLSRIDPRSGAFLIYTSGTTGNPKGAVLSHDNLVFTSDIVSRYWQLPYGKGDLFSFLPLCHIAERLQSTGVGISQRYAVNFCTKFENVTRELVEVQPTLLLSVPRLWEKMMEGVVNRVRQSPPPRRKLAEWALSVGERVGKAKYSGQRPSITDLAQFAIADRLVLRKVKHAMGLGGAELLASGAAALAPHVSRWFRSLGLEILEDFGQTESTGVICMTEPGVESAGTVGKPLPGTEFRIAEDGEILTRGRHVFVGYFKDDAATAATLEGGWLHTGDLGFLNDQGQVQIRGRKKEVMKTSGGKMVAPLPIEEDLKSAELISQVCMVGDGRKYLAALITLSEQGYADWQARGGAASGMCVTDSVVMESVQKLISDLNKRLAQYEQIKKFAVIVREFSIADGEMTPTMKMKRNVIEQRFKDLIDSLYSGSGAD